MSKLLWKQQVIIMLLTFLGVLLISEACTKGFCQENLLPYPKHIDMNRLFGAMAMQESSCNPKAIGLGGEIGLFQLSCDTARDMGVDKCKKLFNPKTNYNTAVKYFWYLYNRLGGDIHRTLDAYNRGERNVKRCRHTKSLKVWREFHPYAFQVMDRYNRKDDSQVCDTKNWIK